MMVGLTPDFRITLHDQNCGWANRKHDVCDNPGCIEVAERKGWL